MCPARTRSDTTTIGTALVAVVTQRGHVVAVIAVKITSAEGPLDRAVPSVILDAEAALAIDTPATKIVAETLAVVAVAIETEIKTDEEVAAETDTDRANEIRAESDADKNFVDTIK